MWEYSACSVWSEGLGLFLKNLFIYLLIYFICSIFAKVVVMIGVCVFPGWSVPLIQLWSWLPFHCRVSTPPEFFCQLESPLWVVFCLSSLVCGMLFAELRCDAPPSLLNREVWGHVSCDKTVGQQEVKCFSKMHIKELILLDFII